MFAWELCSQFPDENVDLLLSRHKDQYAALRQTRVDLTDFLEGVTYIVRVGLLVEMDSYGKLSAVNTENCI